MGAQIQPTSYWLIIHTYQAGAIKFTIKVRKLVKGVDKKISVGACLGMEDSCIDFGAVEKPLHSEVLIVVQQLKHAAQLNGFELTLASGYRSFAQQLNIWNAKAKGERPVLDSSEREISRELMNSRDIMFAILRWSALPGASRHHWGTDFDVYDKSALPADYQLQLTVAETQEGGVFANMYRWLESFLPDNTLGFYRPYAQDSGGIAPEPWHISYKPLAVQYQNILSIDTLAKHIQSADILLKKDIMQNLDEIYDRFILPPVC